MPGWAERLFAPIAGSKGRVRAYLAAKEGWSRAFAWLDGSKRNPLPPFGDHEELATYMETRLRYVPDPLGGAIDFYTHPERTQWELDNSWPRDCDDYASYAFLALSRLPGYEPRMVTVVDRGLKWSHVICLFRQGHRAFVLDTNGLNELRPGMSPTQDLDQAKDLMQEFYGPSGARYGLMVPHRYPFGGLARPL